MPAPAPNDADRFATWWRGGAEDELRDLLMRAWDPAGVAGEPAAADEYDAYLLGVVGALRRGAGPTDVAAHLAGIERTMMGRETASSDERVLAAGRLVHAWFAGTPKAATPPTSVPAPEAWAADDEIVPLAGRAPARRPVARTPAMAEELTVEVATPDDVRGIARVMRGVADEGRWIGTPAGTEVAALEERFAASVADPGTHLLVLRGGGDVVGLASLGREHVRGAHGIGMSIAADWRRRGGGGLLLDGLLEHAATNPDVHKVELQVWPHNGGAIALYVSRGFVVEGILRDHWRRPDGALWSSMIMGWWPPRAA